MRISPEIVLQRSSAVATGIGFFVSPARAAGAQAQLGLDADTSGGSALPIRSFPAGNFFAFPLLHYATSRTRRRGSSGRGGRQASVD